jgi:hypothetical protein
MLWFRQAWHGIGGLREKHSIMASKRQRTSPEDPEKSGSSNVRSDKRLSTDPTGVADALGLEREGEVPDLGEVSEGSMASGIQTGQTTRGSFGTDQSTGGGTYMDRRSGQFGNDSVAQPDNDSSSEPDPVDPKL